MVIAFTLLTILAEPAFAQSGDGHYLRWNAIDCVSGTCTPTGETCVNDAPSARGSNVGTDWWVGRESPLGNGAHLLVSNPFRKVSADWSNPVHVDDCEIAPEAVYGVRAVEATPDPADTEKQSDELPVETTLFATASSS